MTGEADASITRPEGLSLPPGLRQAFPLLCAEPTGDPLVYLDSASTTQKPASVIQALMNYYQEDNANVHRGSYPLAERSTQAFEDARRTVARFIGAASEREVIFTRGTTESINLVAESWGLRFLGAGDEILLSPMEHHSNLVPWQRLAHRQGAVLKFLEMDAATGMLDLSRLDVLMGPRVRLLALTHVSNVLGTINPVRQLADEARRRGIVTLLDAAQSAGHFRVDAGELGCDFIAFSGHKMYGPTGVGVLYGREQLLQAMPPWQGGGEMVESVDWLDATYAPPPHRFEAGTPPIAGAIGLAEAVRFIEGLGWEALGRHESHLTAEACHLLGSLPYVRLLGDPEPRAGVISFVVDGIHAQDVAAFAGARNIAVRAGHHCAQPLLKRLGITSAVRASLACYNTTQDLRTLVEELVAMRRHFS